MQAYPAADSASRSLDGLVVRSSPGNSDISSGARSNRCHYPLRRAELKEDVARKDR